MTSAHLGVFQVGGAGQVKVVPHLVHLVLGDEPFRVVLGVDDVDQRVCRGTGESTLFARGVF